MSVDPALREFATETQWAAYIAFDEHGGYRQAARACGYKSENAIRDAVNHLFKKAALRGYSPPHDMTRVVPDGYHVKGVSTYYGQDGKPAGQWVKSSIDRERQEEIFREALAAMAETLPRSKPAPGPKHPASHLMACYPIGDHHLGMLSWHQETGADYDLDIGERLLIGAIDHLVGSVPSCERSVVAILGDYLHIDSFDPVTPASRNLLDADGRFPKLVRAGIRCSRYTIEASKRHHQHVLVIVEIGNHDPSSAIFLAECLANIYENDPRVTVDTSPRHFHYFEFGKCLVGVHHGHGVKMADLPLIMATDKPEEWGRTEYRYWWTGHVHHDQAKDFAGVRVESFRVLPPTDAWAANKGYRSLRDMKAIVLHRDHGEVARHIVNPSMIAAA